MKCLHCKKEGVAHKLCRSHYNKWYRHNNPLYIKLKGEKKKCLHCGKKVSKEICVIIIIINGIDTVTRIIRELNIK